MKGWECPKCGSSWNPTVMECGRCAPKAKPVVAPTIPDPTPWPSRPLPITNGSTRLRTPPRFDEEYFAFMERHAYD